MNPFQLVRSDANALAEAAMVTRTLFVPDLEGNWRELRPRATAAAPPGAAATPRSPLFALHAA